MILNNLDILNEQSVCAVLRVDHSGGQRFVCVFILQ